MSPLALFYILLAGSPIFHNEWTHDLETPFEHSTAFNRLSTRGDWLLRKALRNTFSTGRSFLNELTGDFHSSSEYSPIFSTESILRNVNVIRRIAEVNPIMIEKLLTCPETARLVENVLRNVEPETLFLVERLIKKNVPTYIREKISRRVVKSLIRSTVMPRRSIYSEMYPVEESSFYPTSSFSNSLFESPIFSSIFGESSYEVEPIVKNLIEKLIRRAEVPEVVLSKLVRKLVKKSIRHHHNVSPIEALLKVSTRRHSIKPILVSIQLKKVAELKSLIRHLTVESHLTTPSVWTIRRIAKCIRDIAAPERVLLKKALRTSNTHMPAWCNMCEMCESTTPFAPLTSSPICSMCTEFCSTMTPTPFSFVSKKMNKDLRTNMPVWCNMCSMCESTTPFAPFTTINKPFCSMCTEFCPTMTPFSFVAKSMNKDRRVAKLIKKVVKTVSKKEKLCRVCEKVCESSTFSTLYSVSPIVNSKMCRVCENICEESSIFSSPLSSVFGRHSHKNVEYKLLKSLVKSSSKLF